VAERLALRQLRAGCARNVIERALAHRLVELRERFVEVEDDGGGPAVVHLIPLGPKRRISTPPQGPTLAFRGR